MSETIKVLIVEPMREPYAKEIDAGLKSLQTEVGGNIQAVYPFDEEAAVICNEEGKINGLELNRALKDDNGRIYDVIAGTFLICGLDGDRFGSLPDDLIRKFSEQFKRPETFIRVGHEMISIPAESRNVSDFHIEKNNGIVSFGDSSENMIVHKHSRQAKTSSIDIRCVGKTDKKPSVKKTLEQAKKEQGEQAKPKPRRKSPPER